MKFKFIVYSSKVYLYTVSIHLYIPRNRIRVRVRGRFRVMFKDSEKVSFI